MNDKVPMRVLVCGGRDFHDWDLLEDILNTLWRVVGNFDIISGMAKGADTLAVDYATKCSITIYEFPADWEKHGKAAGHIRNQQMLDEGKPDLVVAFPTKNSKGTWDMIRRAEKKGVRVEVIE